MTETTTLPAPPAAATIERYEQMFPVLAPEQIAALALLGTERSFAPGEPVWNAGDRNVDFHVVLAGTLEIISVDAFGQASVIVTLERGQYSGEVAALSGRAVMVAGRARAALDVAALPIERLKDFMVTHASLGETIVRSFILRRVRLIADHAGDLLVVGSRHSAATLKLLDFVTRNGHPHRFVDLEQAADVCDLLQRLDVGPEDTPIVITRRGEPLRNPSLRAVADRLGLSLELDAQAVYDVAIVGAGPAGLASAVYSASEGLDVIVLDPVAPGGQAGTSSKIENYLGFPTGVSGQALAGRAFVQAQKFGARIAIPTTLKALHCGDPLHELELDDGERIRARAVVIASGARYRKPALANLETFEGAGVYYAATFLEAQYSRDEEVVIVGGGNSAGQAAVFLAETARRVYVVVRSAGLAASMSRYLIRRIETTPNIELVPWSELVTLEGGSYLESVRWRDTQTGAETARAVKHLFVFIGAAPNTEFLPDAVMTDANGFICTGPEVMAAHGAARWPLERPPFLLETSCPRVFAAGDVRASSTKRVASAVGEGSVVVQFVHRLLERGGASPLTQSDVPRPSRMQLNTSP